MRHPVVHGVRAGLLLAGGGVLLWLYEPLMFSLNGKTDTLTIDVGAVALTVAGVVLAAFGGRELVFAYRSWRRR